MEKHIQSFSSFLPILITSLMPCRAATPFAECSGEVVGAFGPCGLGRAVLFGGFVHGTSDLRDMDKSCEVIAEILRHLASAPEATEAERNAAVDLALAEYDRYC